MLFFVLPVGAQETEAVESPIMRAYNELVNYTPKALKNIPVPEALGGWELGNLSQLRIVYGYQSEFNLTQSDVVWLNESVNELAAAFYLEGNPLLLRSTGGYSGCTESEYELKKEVINGNKVTIINFCHGCKGSLTGENEFIDIFNNRTKKLLEASR